ncbi:hypothetical protein EUGRSUZ_A02789 [Eucalyptus grandis]|uniref:Uncharacterized protein n=2 Tax=Eucalyptus grandis TaxID=71139 RepID=A0ACC3M7L7_EUCGR|nr:hypothetical protein EUGRSUZ_A02789 [Eucalyptus grandis]
MLAHLASGCRFNISIRAMIAGPMRCIIGSAGTSSSAGSSFSPSTTSTCLAAPSILRARCPSATTKGIHI